MSAGEKIDILNGVTGEWVPVRVLDYSFSIFGSGRTVTLCYEDRRVETVTFATWAGMRKSNP